MFAIIVLNILGVLFIAALGVFVWAISNDERNEKAVRFLRNYLRAVSK